MPTDPLNPFYSIEWMVDRKTITGKALGKEHAISIEGRWTFGRAAARTAKAGTP